MKEQVIEQTFCQFGDATPVLKSCLIFSLSAMKWGEGRGGTLLPISCPT